MPTETEAAAKVVHIPLAELFPSKTNRKIPDSSISEMAASIKEHGILQPILARPRKGGGFEIVCGEVRWRGARAVGNGVSMPAVVKELTDEEAQAIQIVENLQRTDPSPIEEARAFGNLKKLLGNANTERIATEVGKDAAHVAQRLKLLDLCDQGQRVLADGRIGVGHALLIAPLQPDQQKAVLKWALGFMEEGEAHGHWEGRIKSVHTATAVKSFIEREFMLSLADAPFDIKDAKLNPKMGACTTCPHNTATVTSLFPDIKGATCTLPECFFIKRRAAIDVKVEEIAKEHGQKVYRLGIGLAYKENEGKSKIPVDGYLHSTNGLRIVEKGDECKSSRLAVLVFRGSHTAKEIKAKVGDVTTICANPKCDKHGSPSRSGLDRRAPLKGLAFVKHKEGNLKKSQPQRLRWAIFRDLAPRLLKGKWNADNDSLMLLAANQASRHLYYDNARDAAKALGYEKPKDKLRGGYGRTPWDGEIEKHFKGNAWAWLLAINAAEDIRADHKKPEDSQLFQIAKAYKVDIGALRDEIQKADKAAVDKMTVNAKAKEARDKAASAKPKTAKQKADDEMGKNPPKALAKGKCKHCGCTEVTPCGPPPCAWANKKRTVCTNPACLKKAGFSAAKIKQLSSAA